MVTSEYEISGPSSLRWQVDVLEPLLVVSLREVGAVLGAAALGALERADAGALGVVEHVAELDRRQDVLVEDAAVVIDVGRFGLLLEAANGLECRLDAGLLAEHGDLVVHRLAQLQLDLRDAAAGALLA